jgi:pimeloyl-ACP methyl ester carboxylesterase
MKRETEIERRKPVLGRTVPGISPKLQRRLRRFFSITQAVSRELAARLAMRLFLTPPRRKVEDVDVPVVAQARQLQRRCGDDVFTLWCWGSEGPRVVLMHGWGSHAARFGHFVAPLRAAGFSVIGIDAPAHGSSPGKLSDLPRFRSALESVLREHDPVHAVVGHSLGGGAIVSLLAEVQSPRPRAVCLVGVPSDMAYILDSFAMMLGLDDRTRAAFHRRFTERFGMSARDISVAAAAPSMTLPTLVVHDEDDNVAPFAQGQAIAAAIAGAAFFSTRGLGHSGALRDSATIERVVAFLRSVQPQ